MHTTQLQGEFYIDGSLSYSGLFPQISFINGLTLYRRQYEEGKASTVPDGPHLYFPFFHPYLLTTWHSIDEIRNNPQYLYQGSHVGAIGKSGGYLHGNSNMRHITNILLMLSFSKEAVLVKINGEAGPIIPGNGYGTDSLSFNLWFSIPIVEIIKIAPETGEDGAKALITNLEKL